MSISGFFNTYHFDVMHSGAARLILNYRQCRLCQNHYLVDSGDAGICGSELCQAVKIAEQLQKEAAENAEFALWMKSKYKR